MISFDKIAILQWAPRDETITLRKALQECSALRSAIVSSLGDYWRMVILSNEII